MSKPTEDPAMKIVCADFAYEGKPMRFVLRLHPDGSASATVFDSSNPSSPRHRTLMSLNIIKQETEK